MSLNPKLSIPELWEISLHNNYIRVSHKRSSIYQLGIISCECCALFNSKVSNSKEAMTPQIRCTTL